MRDHPGAALEPLPLPREYALRDIFIGDCRGAAHAFDVLEQPSDGEVGGGTLVILLRFRCSRCSGKQIAGPSSPSFRIIR